MPEIARLLKVSSSVAAVLVAVVFASACAHTERRGTEAASEKGDRPAPTVTLSTSFGDLVVEVAPKAAPDAAAHWLQLAGSYYPGLAFTYTKPHVEIVSEARDSGPDRIELETALDAASLGLDRKLIQGHAEAMEVLQWELIRAHARMGKGDERPALLKEWIEEWRTTGSPDFLVGESWQRVNEALGYEYRSGLQSLPVTAGAVALQPVSPTRASMRLSIALADMPQRTGRWMVIGRVVEGLEVAREISVQTLKGQGTPEAKEFKPLEPVVIDRVEVAAAR